MTQVEAPMRPFNNLLVVMTDRHIGNLLVSLYAIKRVAALLKPDQTLCCVIDYHLLGLASYLLPTVEFIPCTIRGKKPSPVKKAQLFTQLLWRLKNKRIDTAVDLYGHGESHFICKASGADFISAFYCRPKLKPKYHWTGDSTTLTAEHQIDYYLFPFTPVFGAINSMPLEAPKLKNSLSRVNKILSSLGRSHQKPLVVIHPGAGKTYKLWPIHHWQSLIKKLEEAGKEVLLIGAGSDRQQIDAICASVEISPLNGYQQFNLIETIHLGFVAETMIGNDSGPTHLMATTPTKVFSLFGPTDHTLWSPLSANSRILKSETPCLEACSKQICQREKSCLEDLSPDYVFNQLGMDPLTNTART